MHSRGAGRLGVRAVAIGLVAVAAGGCARADTVADRHIVEMREALDKVQAEQDRTNQRIGLLEVAADERKDARPAAKPATPAPAARTVQLGDDNAGRESDDPNDPNARPEIRLQGSGVAAPRPVRGKTRREREIDERGTDTPRPAAEPDTKKRAPAPPETGRGAGPKESR